MGTKHLKRTKVHDLYIVDQEYSAECSQGGCNIEYKIWWMDILAGVDKHVNTKS